jgi:predicted RNase H-like HicB family nuclease
MSEKVNIVIEKNESGFLISCPELEEYQFQDNSLDSAFARLKEAITIYMKKANASNHTTGESILKIVENFTNDMTDEELSQLPTDAAEQHDHYLYRTPKKA